MRRKFLQKGDSTPSSVSGWAGLHNKQASRMLGEEETIDAVPEKLPGK